MELGFLDLLTRWILLSVAFYSLIYVFQGKVTLEGIFGYLPPLLIQVPMNVYVEFFSSALPLPGSPMATVFITLVMMNLLFMILFNSVLPGLSCSSYLFVLLFALAFSAIAFAVWRYIPLVPPLPLGF